MARTKEQLRENPSPTGREAPPSSANDARTSHLRVAEKPRADDAAQDALDEALDETFPASDAVSVTRRSAG